MKPHIPNLLIGLASCLLHAYTIYLYKLSSVMYNKVVDIKCLTNGNFGHQNKKHRDAKSKQVSTKSKGTQHQLKILETSLRLERRHVLALPQHLRNCLL
jgi:hypothetical protein